MAEDAEIGRAMPSDVEKAPSSQDATEGSQKLQNAPARSDPEDIEKSAHTASSPTSLQEEQPPKPEEQQKRTMAHDVALVIIICLAQVVLQASLAQSIIPLDYISASFGIDDPGQQSWLTAAFSLTVGTFILPAGRLGDMYGHKAIFICGVIWYGLWAIICGVAVYSGIILFSIARAFQGIGPSLMVPNALALLGREFGEGSKKNLVFSLFGACAPGGYIAGGVISALFAQFTWWPWTYWAAGIFAMIYALSSSVIIPNRKDELEPRSEFSFDWLGCLFGVSGLVLFNFAWNQAGVVGWQEPYTYVLLIVGMVLLGVLCLVELKYASHPLLPVRSLSRAALLALGCVAVGWGSFGIWMWYLVQILMNLRGATPLLTIAETCGVAVSGAIAALLTAYLLPRVRPGIIMTIAMLAFAVGQVLVATAPLDQTYWAQFFPMVIIVTFGMDLSFPSGTIILSDSMAREDQGVAASLVTTVVNYSISLGLGIAGTITRQLIGDSKDTQTILHGYRGAFYFAIGLDVLGVVIAVYFSIKER